MRTLVKALLVVVCSAGFATSSAYAQHGAASGGPLAAVASVGSESSATEACGIQGICSCCHYVVGPSAGGVQGLHGDCLICITEGGCHPACGESFVLGPKGFQRQTTYKALVGAALKRDIAAVIRLGADMPGM